MADERLKPADRDKIRDRFAGLVRDSRFIKDLDLRIQSSKDRVTISEAIGSSLHGSDEKVNQAKDNLIEIIRSNGQRPMYSRILATCTLFDIATDHELWNPELVNDLTGAINEKGDDEKRILFGALYASATARSLQDGSDLSPMYESLKARASKDKYSLEFLVAVEAARSEIKDLFDRFSFRKAFSTAVIHGTVDTLGDPSLGSGIPESVVHLGSRDGKLRLPTLKKLSEMVLHGVPNPRSGLNEHRTLGVLIGVESPLLKNRSARGKIEKNPDKRFSYIYLRGLRKLDTEEDNLFDALTFYLAVKISRTKNVREDLKIIDGSELSDDEKKAKRSKIIARSVKLWSDRITEALGYDNEGKPISIFSFALQEYRSFNPKWIGSDDEALTKLKKSAFKSAFQQFDNGKIDLRAPIEVSQKYAKQVWVNDLDDDDKFQLAMAHLEDRDSVLWQQIDKDAPHYKAMIDRVVMGISKFEDSRPEVAKAMVEAVMDAANKRYQEILTIRCETIRDIADSRGFNGQTKE